MKGRKLDSPRHDQQSPAEAHTYVDDSGPDTGQPWGGPSGKMNMQPHRGGYYFIKFTISARHYVLFCRPFSVVNRAHVNEPSPTDVASEEQARFPPRESTN
ncbi:hypothetical protein K0M31_007595 [Melipona bicolor]|uniref:Uncharacterized protein n=1 Tax=Melipona bicolor TaxID=60889 RepID=A0AA40GBT1_9HYME|nr:hypothetical protein K0M31_007595 [Melipona bicolor]